MNEQAEALEIYIQEVIAEDQVVYYQAVRNVFKKHVRPAHQVCCKIIETSGK